MIEAYAKSLEHTSTYQDLKAKADKAEAAAQEARYRISDAKSFIAEQFLDGSGRHYEAVYNRVLGG